MIEVFIPQWHPAALNKLLQGRWQSNKLKTGDRNMIAHYFRNEPKAKTKREVHLTVILGKGKRGCDVDAYDKSLLDALVKAGMLVDDNRRWCTKLPTEYTRATGTDKWGSVIRLVDIDT